MYDFEFRIRLNDGPWTYWLSIPREFMLDVFRDLLDVFPGTVLHTTPEGHQAEYRNVR